MDQSEVLKFERAAVGTIKLSEAMRIGAQRRPQCTAGFFKHGGSCAVGAALEAITGLTNYFDEAMPSPDTAWPDVPDELWGDIYTRNDRGHTREQIADWLEAQGF